MINKPQNRVWHSLHFLFKKKTIKLLLAAFNNFVQLQLQLLED